LATARAKQYAKLASAAASAAIAAPAGPNLLQMSITRSIKMLFSICILLVAASALLALSALFNLF
jgi:uncharacterized membrane protein YfcA